MSNPDRAATGWSVVAVALLVMLLLVAFERAFAMVFVLNFATGGPGPSVLLVLLFLSGLLYPLGLHRTWPHTLFQLDLALVAASTLVLFSLLPHPGWAALTAFLAWLVATPLLFAAVARLRLRFAEGAALGVLIHQAGRAWLDTAPYASSAAGWLWVTVAAVALFAVWILLARSAFADGPDTPNARLVTPFLFLQYVFIGAPAAVALWLGVPLLPLWIAGLAGLAGGLAFVRLRILHHPMAVGISASLFVLVFLDLIFFTLLPLVSYPLAQATLIHLLARDCARRGRPSVRATGWTVAGLQTLALVALFLHAVGPSWAFMTAPVGALAQGRAPLFLLALGLILVVLTIAFPPFFAHRPTSMTPRRGEVSYAAAIALALVVVLGGLWVHEAPPGAPPATGPPLRVATYNVHQWFSEEQTGHYNLEQVAQVIEASGAEIIGLQETEGGRITSGNLDGLRWLGHRLGMHVAYGPPSEAQVYGVSLLSEYPIVDETWIALPNEESVERVAVRVTVETSIGPLPVVVTHFQTQDFERDRSVQALHLLQWVAPLERAFVVGDFNTPASATDPVYRMLQDDLEDAWVASGRGNDEGPTSLGPNPKRIDHIWLKGPWEARDCATYHRPYASDHRLVACSIFPEGWPPLDG